MVVELIAKDKKEKLEFEGKCKIRIDAVSKILLIEPCIEEFKMISAMFKWKFVAQKNILCIFAEHDFQDFALIFDNSIICKKVFDNLFKKGAIQGEMVLIQQRFLPALFAEILKNDETSSKMKEILVQWIDKHEGDEKEEYFHLLRSNNIYDLIYPDEVKNKKFVV
uniref:BACK domain-containing protein n=1 Tax=Panagrolaimus sp. ES5 TaxID=591445 RepID=A0AC34FHS4_9BILA